MPLLVPHLRVLYSLEVEKRLLPGFCPHTPLDLLPDHHPPTFIAGNAGRLTVVGGFFTSCCTPGPYSCAIGDPVDGIAALRGRVSYPPFGLFLWLFKSGALVCRSQFGHLEAHVALHPSSGAVGTATSTRVAVAVGSRGRTDTAESRAQVLQEILECRDGRGN